MIIEKAQSDLELIREAQDNLTLCNNHEKDIRKESKRCMKMLALEQWEDPDLEARAGRISVVIDQLGQYRDQVVNDWRRNRLGIKVSPGDDVATEDTARVIDGLVRQIEYQSHAHSAYDYAFECMTGGNRGYVEIGLKRRKGSLKRDITILKCPNPDAIYEDPFYTELDTSDRQFVLKTEVVNRKLFKKRYKNAKITDFESAEKQAPSWFPDSESMIIAEYWRLEETARKIQLLNKPIAVSRDGKILKTDEVYDTEYASDTIYKGNLPEGVMIVTDPRTGELMEDDEPEREIIKYLLTGAECLDTESWPGMYIPIVPFYGKEIWYDGKKKLFSLISRSLDAQKGANYSYSSLFERLGQQIKTPVVGYVGQFKTMRQQWQDAAIRTFAFLEVDQVQVGGQLAPLPQRTDFDPKIDQTVLATNVIQNAVRSTMGINTAILGQDTGKAKSGVAIKALQSEGDNGSYDFVDNGGRGIELAGCFIVDLVPKIYDDADIIQIRNEQQEVVAVAVNQDITQMQNPPANQTANHYLTEGKYHVVVSAAPSHDTMRQEGQEAVQQFIDLMDPQMRSKAVPVALRLSDKFGMRELADAIDPPKGKINPQQLAATVQQLQQMLVGLTHEVKALNDEREKKILELQSNERIKAMDVIKGIEVAKITVSKDLDKAEGDRVAAQMEQVMDHAHEITLKAADMVHEHSLAQQQQEAQAQQDQQQPDNAQPTASQ